MFPWGREAGLNFIHFAMSVAVVKMPAAGCMGWILADVKRIILNKKMEEVKYSSGLYSYF